ncbi:MAG: hypothetical protein R6U63_10805 [Longimicrobiales bacterium]
MHHNHSAGSIVLACALAALAGTPLVGQEVQYTGSMGYATGSYTFEERTSSFSILNGLGLTATGWSVSATLPVVIQNSGAVSTIGGMQVPTGSSRGGMTGGRPGMGGTAEETTGAYEAVIGDPVIRVSFNPYQGFGTLRFVEVQAMAKAPVADPASGVGTGQWDAGAGVSAGIGFGQTYLFGDASVWNPGDMPDLALDPYGTVSAGVGRSLSERLSGLASVSVSSPMIDGMAAPATVGGGLSYRLGDNRSLSLGASYGLTNSAPDISVYVGWSASP